MTCRAWTLKEFDRTALKELTVAIAEQNTEELEQNALDDEPWSEQKYAATLAAQQKEAGLLAGVLAARGITDPAEALTLLAGGPAVLGMWAGSLAYAPQWSALALAVGAGAILQVIVEVTSYLMRQNPDRQAVLFSPEVLGGFLGGIAFMYATAALIKV